MAVRRSSARWAVVASAIGVLYVAWAAYEAVSYGDHHGDFPTFYFVPKAAFEDGVSIYDSGELRKRTASAAISRVCPWLYPPHKALLLRPLSWLDYETSRRVLYGANIAMALALPYLLFARLRLHGRHRHLAAFAAAALPFFSPLHGNLYEGNLSLIALVFVLLAWDAGVRGRRAEGLWLAMATLMKLYPAALAGGLLLRRAWKPAAVMVAALASFEAAALASLPASEWRVFMTEVAPMGGMEKRRAASSSRGRPSIKASARSSLAH